MLGLNRSLARAGVRAVNHQGWTPVKQLSRVFGRLGIQRNLVRLSGRAFVVGLMWPNDARVFPFSYLWEIVPYIFDCWPVDYPKWEKLLRRHRIRVAFFTARGSADHFRERLPGMASYWGPEACDPADYDHAIALKDREIDVLELGRKYTPYHDRIEGPLGELEYRFLYSRDGTRTVIFEGPAALRKGLGNTKIAVSFPKSMTHAEGQVGMEKKGAGGLETVTLRYFEQMASKCLIVGHCPAELEEIFGYNPVIEGDLEDPVGQLKKIMSSIDEYQQTVDDNYRRLLEVGTWENRVEMILSILAGHGYCPARSA